MTIESRPGTRETLDEAIDRVAAAMTAVPGDAQFATRLAARLPVRRASWLGPRGMVFAALAVAVVALAVSMTIRRPGPLGPAPQLATGAGAPATVTPTSPAPVIEATVASAVTRTAASPARPRRRYISHDHIVPQIAALAVPAALDVDAVDSMLLTIKPVELAPLDLASLTFDDLDSPDHPKE